MARLTGLALAILTSPWSPCPFQKTEGLEYRTTMIEHPFTVNGQQGKEARYLITAYVPVSTEGSPTILVCRPEGSLLVTGLRMSR